MMNSQFLSPVPDEIWLFQDGHWLVPAINQWLCQGRQPLIKALFYAHCVQSYLAQLLLAAGMFDEIVGDAQLQNRFHYALALQ